MTKWSTDADYITWMKFKACTQLHVVMWMRSYLNLQASELSGIVPFPDPYLRLKLVSCPDHTYVHRHETSLNMQKI